MKISRLGAMLLLFPTLYPAAYFFIFLLSFSADGGSVRTPFFGSFEVLMRFHIATMLISLALIIFYVVHAVKNSILSSEQRLLWVVLLILGGLFAGPVYWYLYLWRDPKQGAEDEPTKAKA